MLTKAPGNDAEIGGLKVVSEGGWFAARPSGTEDVYKVYAESFRSEEHLERVIEEAQEIVKSALGAAGRLPAVWTTCSHRCSASPPRSCS